MQGFVPSLAPTLPLRLSFVLGVGLGLPPAAIPLCSMSPEWDGVALPATPSCYRPSWGPWLQGLRQGASLVVVGVLSSASTSLTLFFFPPFFPYLSLSLFLSSDLWTQDLLISWMSFVNSVPTDISFESSSLVTSTLVSRIPTGARFFDPCTFL